MPSLADLSRKPDSATSDEHFGSWFAALAAKLLNEVDLLIAGEPYRLAELEAYYYGPDHPDPFTHRDPVQYHTGRWYFHRTAGEHRGGSFKGVDLTFGDGQAMFGVLIRTIIAADGTMIDGPSLTVDHILAKTGFSTVPALDAEIGTRKFWNKSSPLAVRPAETSRDAEVLHTARVGLTLKRSRGKPDAPKYVMLPYRYVSEPRRITKGKPHMALALYQQGKDTAAIHELTGVPRKAIERYVADFETGKAVPDFTGYVGKDLGTGDLCRLMGTWAAKYGSDR